ncbi:response regulator [Oscillatoria sp. FACHB-1407]|uniref:response regulator n=1 Tax=Oscillatoria sp. FACHB-1407 TaxID=2692847 RepID=UPI0016895ABB|nr:response regulator [Oscillatoria sp. FACHB-1407]MBD2464300.1 response regulator [Oscillatoria sp. FACHB-1407]
MESQKILIVDDSKTIRMQIKDMLPKGNFEILEAKDGAEGLEMIQQERPSLVLLDFFMPRMNGWEVVQQVQTFPKLQTIPIVMMSGRREDVEKAVPELFDYFEFVSKPFEQNLLLKAIKSATTKAKQRYQELQHTRPVTLVNSTSHGVEAESPNGVSDRDGFAGLKAEIFELRNENAKLKSELMGLKKQVSQILLVLKQKLK